MSNRTALTFTVPRL